MSIKEELKKIFQTAWGQIVNTSGAQPHHKPNTQTALFNRNFRLKAPQRGLTEKDALDVYYHGTVERLGKMCHDYNGYRLCIYYYVHKKTGQTWISTIWKE